MRSKILLGALLAGALFAGARPARANGRFPEANQVVFDPRSPEHLLVRTTFGLLESRDGAQSFSWTCETALDLSGESDAMLAITASGAQVAATYAGIRRSSDGCSYQSPPDLAGQIVPDLALDAGQPSRVLAFRTRGLGGGMFESALVRSEDEGQTWLAIEPPLPSDFLPLSVDIAASDSARIYLTGRLGAATRYASVLLRSDDAGQSFERFEIPETAQQRLAFIAAVDATDRDRVFVRVDDPAGTLVLVSADAGRSFRQLLRGNGRMPGFAIAKDASEIAVGGPSDGIWLGAPDGVGLEQRSSVAPSCLGYGPDGLYACSDATQVGSLLLRSRDGGVTFETLVSFDSLCGTTACESTSEVARSCRSEWEFVAPTLGTTCGTARAENPPSVAAASFRASGGGCALANNAAASPGWGLLIALMSVFRRASRGRVARRKPP